MAEALFISRNDIVKKTALGGNVDTDKFLQFVESAQEIHVQNYMGTDLYDKISADIVANNLSNPYKSLVSDYIKPMLIHYAMAEYLPWGAYTIGNGGIFKHSSENSETVSKSEIDYLMSKERQMAEHYASRFQKYMIYNQTSFPEYFSNTEDDVRPDKSRNYTGWIL